MKIYDEKTAKQCVEFIFDKLDSDGSGTIDPDEWLVATINKENLLSNENIEKCFKLMDKDDGGSISLDEIKDMLFQGQEIDPHVFEHIMADVDEDGDGELDKEEFCKILTAMINVTEKKLKKSEAKNVNL